MASEQTRQALFSTPAHIFQIDPETKKSWVPFSRQAVNVSFYHDTNKGTYKILSIEGSKALINSTVTEKMIFTKTSQKFGQWADPRHNTMYGLGFQSESELNKFSEKFAEAKQNVSATSERDTNSSHRSTNSGPSKAESSTTSGPSINGMLSSSPSLGKSASQANSSASGEDENMTSHGSHRSCGSATDLQMKYENDRLKTALAQSSANAKKWETEFQTLKNNNARLTAALQESTVNVEKWKEQLNNYKEENSRLRKKLVDSGDSVTSSPKSTRDAEQRLHECEIKLKRKEEEVIRLSQHGSGEVNLLREKNSELGQKIQSLETDLSEARTHAQQTEDRMRSMRASDSKLKQANEIRACVDEKLLELTSLQKKLALTLKPTT